MPEHVIKKTGCTLNCAQTCTRKDRNRSIIRTRFVRLDTWLSVASFRKLWQKQYSIHPRRPCRAQAGINKRAPAYRRIILIMLSVDIGYIYYHRYYRQRLPYLSAEINMTEKKSTILNVKIHYKFIIWVQQQKLVRAFKKAKAKACFAVPVSRSSIVVYNIM